MNKLLNVFHPNCYISRCYPFPSSENARSRISIHSRKPFYPSFIWLIVKLNTLTFTIFRIILANEKSFFRFSLSVRGLNILSFHDLCSQKFHLFFSSELREKRKWFSFRLALVGDVISHYAATNRKAKGSSHRHDGIQRTRDPTLMIM